MSVKGAAVKRLFFVYKEYSFSFLPQKISSFTLFIRGGSLTFFETPLGVKSLLPSQLRRSDRQ